MSEILNDLKAEKERLNKEEKMQTSLISRIRFYQRERFEKAERQLYFQTDQYLADMFFIQEKVMEWLEKAKDGSTQKKVLNDMAMALMRMDAYTVTVRTSAITAVEHTMRDEDVLKNYETEIRKRDLEILQLKREPEKLQKEIDKLKKQLDFGKD